MAFCWADMLLEVDENGYILFVAGATESLLGCLPERLIGEALDKLVIKSERPLLRAYLHASPGIKRLEELDLDFQLIEDDGIALGNPVPLSLSGYMISEPIGRYFIAARHRSIRPRARSGIDRLILQNTLSAVSSKTGKNDQQAETAARMASSHSEALVVLENLAALRSQAETDATNELARLIGIGIGNRRSYENLEPDGGYLVDEPMIELERRIVAYASALRADLDDPDCSDAANAPDPFKNLKLATGGYGTSGASTLTNNDLFGRDYDLASGFHRLTQNVRQPIENGERETNLTRAVAYALNRLQHRGDSDVSAERLSASLPHLIQETLKSVRAFREIVQNGSFAVALQPIVHLESLEMHHYEALARFHHGGSALAVDQIIHFAEGTGLITEFDLAMCQKVLDHITLEPERVTHSVAVNLSGHSLEQQDFLPALEQILDRYDIDPAKIMFEVTETSRIRGLRDVNDGLQRLRTRGHLVCLDDFGAGAANFEYLSALDVDIIKFDGGAMRTALSKPKGRAFIKATALLCRDLGIHTIAEMIYDQTSFELVRDLGIDYGQGYHLGAPVTLASVNTGSSNTTQTANVTGGGK
ncbi:EAL domain-containing protein [Thalassospira xiamenensis]|jgi:EAL domain-containing protein (putative c-di-GMP-specific phosphodiesterase class I)|nr:EAL domain-containing protein [Thalassospira xiamenensis]KZB54365.1 diguanylate phosphodiesterase [Thalassospira xiamenensis]MCK2165678.1 EAL domain-containing protein [Thalassospira xiamenensis]